MKRISFFLVLMCIATSSYARLGSPVVNLPANGLIAHAPATPFQVPLAGLLGGTVYRVNCLITNSNHEPVVLSFSYSDEVNVVDPYLLNGKSLAYGQGVLDADDSSTVSTVVNTGDKVDGALLFRNLDFDYNVKVDKCVASPVV